MDRLVIVTVLIILFVSGCTTTAPAPESSEPILVDLRRKDMTDCRLHNQKLVEAIEPIEAQHLSWDHTYLDARDKAFPLAGRYITDRTAKKALIRYCPKCRDAHDSFMEQERRRENGI